MFETNETQCTDLSSSTTNGIPLTTTLFPLTAGYLHSQPSERHASNTGSCYCSTCSCTTIGSIATQMATYILHVCMMLMNLNVLDIIDKYK